MIDYSKKLGAEGSIDYLGLWHRAALKLFDFKNKKILDVGCGSGSFLKLIKPVAHKICGLDPNPNNTEILFKNNIPAMTGYIEDYTEELLGQYDFVTCFEVIEHLYSNVSIFKSSARLLILNGIFLVTTPNAFNIVRILKFSFYQMHHDSLLDPTSTPNPEHIRLWSRKMLIKAFLQANFGRVKCFGTTSFFGKTLIIRNPFLVKYFSQNLICFGVKV